MNLKEFIDLGISELLGLYTREEAKVLAVTLLQEVAGTKQYEHIIHPQNSLDEKVITTLVSLLAELKTGNPIQYILGFEWFYGHKFSVSKDVLIPRPETEELVDLILKESLEAVLPASGKPLRVLDVCTGSGCIAHSLAFELCGGGMIYGCDISTQALKIAAAQDIYKDLSPHPDTNSFSPSFFQCDILSEDAVEKMRENGIGELDVIVSNPPYICDGERGLMRANVLDFEPQIALFVPDEDPLLFYRRIAFLGKSVLAPGGKIFFEINERFGNEVVMMMTAMGYSDCLVINDLNGKNRIVRGIVNSSQNF